MWPGPFSTETDCDGTGKSRSCSGERGVAYRGAGRARRRPERERLLSRGGPGPARTPGGRWRRAPDRLRYLDPLESANLGLLRRRYRVRGGRLSLRYR
jgi:hypothetical protein